MAKKDWIALYGNKSSDNKTNDITKPKKDWIALYGDKKNEKKLEGEGFLTKAPRNLTAGLLEGLRGIGNVPHALHLPNAPYFEKTNFRKMVGLNEEPTFADKATEVIGQFLPAIVAPEASLGRLGQAIEKIPKIGKLLKSTVGNSIYPAAYTMTQEEEHPFKESAKVGATQLPFSALMEGIKSKNPYLRIGARLGLGGIGGGLGYGGAKLAGLPTSAQLSVAALGSLLGLTGRNPTREAQKDIAKSIEGTNYQDKLQAAKRLGLSYLTPAEASGSPYLGAIQGNIGKTEGGSKELYAAGEQRIKTEEKAIDKLLNTVYKEQDLSPEVKKLYSQAYKKDVPQETISNLFNNKVIQEAQRIVENKPAYQESLKNVKPNSVAYLDHVKQSLDDMIGSAIKKGDNKEASIMQKTKDEMLTKMDEIAPEYKKARSLYERKSARETIEKIFNTKEMRGTNLYRGLENKQKYEELQNHLRNVPEAQQQLKDMRLVFKDLINPPTVRTAHGTNKVGMNQERNTKKAYSEMLKQLLSFGKNDKTMVELITNPKWADELHKINDLTNKEQKLIRATQLLGRITEGFNSDKQKPMELELIKQVQKK